MVLYVEIEADMASRPAPVMAAAPPSPTPHPTDELKSGVKKWCKKVVNMIEVLHNLVEAIIDLFRYP